VNDVSSVRDVLIKYYGFPAENITVLTNSQATKANIEKSLAAYTDPKKVGPDDRVLIYFSGHGQTVKIPTGGDLGFLIPSDAEIQLDDADNAAPYLATCLQMSTLWNLIDSTAAKHALLIADACYSGILARGRGSAEKISDEFMARLAAKPARQVMTAGGAGEQSFEDQKYGHGMFTQKLLEELKARATKPGDAFMAADLYSTVKVAVGNLTNAKQNPQMHDFATEGQFLFITTDGKPVNPLPQGSTVVSTGGTPPAPAEPRPTGKKRAVVMEIDVRGISGLPSGFDERLTQILSFGLNKLIDREKIAIIERRDLELINEHQGLTGGHSDTKMPGADIIISASVKDFKINELSTGGGNNPVGKVLGGIFGNKKPKLPGGVEVSKKDAIIVLDVRAINAKNGETVARFDSTGKESVTGFEFTDLPGAMRSFQFSQKYFSDNPVGKALKTALNNAVDQMAKEIERAKI